MHTLQTDNKINDFQTFILICWEIKNNLSICAYVHALPLHI